MWGAQWLPSISVCIHEGPSRLPAYWEACQSSSLGLLSLNLGACYRVPPQLGPLPHPLSATVPLTTGAHEVELYPNP